MRIFIFSTAYYPFVGGAEVAIKEITDKLPEHEWHLFTARIKRDLPRVEKIGNVTVHRVGFGLGVFDKWILMKIGGWQAYFFSWKNRCDVAWSMMASWGGLAAWWFSVLNQKIPLVVTLQEGDEIATRKGGLVAIGWRLILSRASIVTVISNYLGEEAKKYGYRGEIILVPNAVDTQKFQVEGGKWNGREELRTKLGLKNDDVALITTSRLVEKNAVDDIVGALTFLPEKIKLVVAGVGPLEDKLIAQVKKVKLENRVMFLGFINNEELPSYLLSSDIFVRPSLSEGMGISFLEAMAVGLPVVATRVGGIADFLDDGITGYVCQVKNRESIARAVRRVIENPAEKDEVVSNANKMILARYTWDKVAPKMNEALLRAQRGNI